MQVLSVYQPHALLLVRGLRRIETRMWHTRHRGLLAIHAARREPPGARALAEREPWMLLLQKLGMSQCSVWPRGAVLGTVELLDCVRVEDLTDVSDLELQLGDFRPGRWAWLLGDPHPWPKPIPARGRLGVFELPLPSLSPKQEETTRRKAI